MIVLSDSEDFRDVVHRLSHLSQIVIIEKTAKSLELSSISLDELCLASAVFKQRFFSKWDDYSINPVEVEPRSLYEISNLIQAKSEVQIGFSRANIKFKIIDQSVKTITLTELRDRPRARIPSERKERETKTTLKTAVFLGIVKDLSVVLDEIHLKTMKNSGDIVFRGKRGGISMEAHPKERGSLSILQDIDIEFPTKHFQLFSPLLSKFEELSLSLSPTHPLTIEGENEDWGFALVLSKIAKNYTQAN